MSVCQQRGSQISRDARLRTATAQIACVQEMNTASERQSVVIVVVMSDVCGWRTLFREGGSLYDGSVRIRGLVPVPSVQAFSLWNADMNRALIR